VAGFFFPLLPKKGTTHPMKPASRIQSAIEINDRIAHSKIPMDNTIRDFMAHKRFIGSKDRADIVDRVYRQMRNYARLGWHIERCGAEDTARTRMIADLILNDFLTHHDIEGIFTGTKYEPEPMEEHEAEFAMQLTGAKLEPDDMPESIKAECPPWAEDRLRALFGERFEEQLKVMQAAAPLDLRVNTLKTSVQDAQSSLKGQKVFAEQVPFSPVGLRVTGKPYMADTKAFMKGLVEIQDEGSQLISLACNAQPGQRILDFCAGGGGKTLGIAASMNNKGNIVAMDINANRLEKGRVRYRKAGVHNVELRSLEDEQHRKWLRRQKGTMDVVLIDAPCSSSGTWRRNPDLRWRHYGPSLDDIKISQAEILERVADKVKPGGRLVYATCSLFREENEDQVEKFLANHPDFKVLPIQQAMPEGTNIPCEGPYLRLFPADHNTDGFFTAVMVRA
jgi:16S rRNA (cytosine967-C5)-methyltransferase